MRTDFIRKFRDWIFTLGTVILVVGITHPTIAAGSCRGDTQTAVAAGRDYQQTARDVIKACSGSDYVGCESQKGDLNVALDALADAHLGVVTTCFATGGVPLPAVRGDLVITEMMVDPAAVADTAGEWFELYNSSGGLLELQGLEFRTRDTAQTFTITESLVLADGEFVVLGNNANESTNGGVLVDHEYSGLALRNAGDQLLVYTFGGQNGGGTLIDEAEYPSYIRQTPTTITGSARNLDPDNFSPSENDGGDFGWCAATSVLPGGDYGTPGAMNIQCP
jgi:hypothetical protein